MNPEAIHYLNVFLGAGAILVQIFCVVSLFLLFFGPKKNAFLDLINKHFLVLGFFMGIGAWSILIYSEIIKFIPCYLCWWQRVFMFPMAFLFGVALWNKDRKVIKYALPLLFAGLFVAAYHTFFYYFGEVSNLPCDASGVSCYQHLVSEFGGYISIPTLSLTSFVFLLTLVAIAHFYGKNNID
jgi:disulfide bond formation protein DsbB